MENENQMIKDIHTIINSYEDIVISTKGLKRIICNTSKRFGKMLEQYNTSIESKKIATELINFIYNEEAKYKIIFNNVTTEYESKRISEAELITTLKSMRSNHGISIKFIGCILKMHGIEKLVN